MLVSTRSFSYIRGNLLLINQASRRERSSFSRARSLELKHRLVSSAYMEEVEFLLLFVGH